MIPAADLATIGAMALATYSTRVGGYLLLRDRSLGSRARTVLDAAPGCVLVAVIAPYFVPRHPAELAALVVACVAAARLPMLAAVALTVGCAALFRQLLV